MYHRRSSAEELRKDEAGEWTLQLINIEPPQTITFCVDPSLQNKKHVKRHTVSALRTLCFVSLFASAGVVSPVGKSLHTFSVDVPAKPFTGHGAVDFLPKGCGKLCKELCESAMKGKTWDGDRIHLSPVGMEDKIHFAPFGMNKTLWMH